MEDETAAPVPTEAIWVQVEIMGHRVRVGQLREVTRFGRTMIEITRPALPAIPARTEEAMGYDRESYHMHSVKGTRHYPETPAMPAEIEWYSPEALFCIKELSEGEVMTMLERGRPRPSSEFVADPAALLASQETDHEPEFTDDDDLLEDED